MSLWSISAAKKKEEVPGTSKWIRKELFILHEFMIKDVEQFAYSVASEFTWIDEQMQEILKDNGENPRLLLESPTKLRGENSPIKQIRERVLDLKSPVKKERPLKEIDVNFLKLSPIRFDQVQSPIKKDHLNKENDAPEELLSESESIKISEQLSKEDLQLDNNDISESKELSSSFQLKRIPSENQDDDYDASVDENSFQAIKTAIRKSIINKNSKTDEIDDDNSFKSASDEVPINKSVETIKMPLKDDNDNNEDKELKTRKSSHTPPHRESQGFALLPHRGPLTVKSAKKPNHDDSNNNQKSRKSLFDGSINLPIENRSKENSNKIATSLYPTLNLIDIPPTKIPSPKKLSPKKIDESNSKLIEAKLESPQKQTSPIKNASPLSNLFSSVGSTLRKAKSKFIKETQLILDDDDNNKIHKPELKSKIPKFEVGSPSPKKKVISRDQLELINKSIPELRQKTPELIDTQPLKPPQLESPVNEESTCNDEEDEKHDSIKFSPVNSIYSSLRQEMNSKSPMKQQDINNKPKSLARMSLSKPDKEIKRKSNGKGLTSLELKPFKIQPKKSFSNDQSSLKRKTQSEEELTDKNQAYRKIGKKLVAPNNDIKRIRTEKVSNVFNKRASRLSNRSQQEEKIEMTTTTTTKPKPTHIINSQALMKAAVLQHARLNNDKPNNPFQSTPSIPINFTVPKSPMTPITTTVLPEIFSESDDDEEGSVLKDWANSPELRNILLKQQYVDPDKVFGPIAPLQMEEIFKTSTSRLAKLKNRGSSAQWTGKDALTFQELENYKKKFKK